MTIVTVLERELELLNFEMWQCNISCDPNDPDIEYIEAKIELLKQRQDNIEKMLLVFH